MLQFNSFFPPQSYGARDIDGRRDCFFENMQSQAAESGCPSYRQYFQENRHDIRQRCGGRDPHDYRTDGQGCRWERGRIADTQITQQNGTSATITAGNNKLTFNKADRSVRIQNADGTEQTVDWKLFEDPHVVRNGQEIGTIKHNLVMNLKDGTRIRTLMGDGNGNAPRPGSQTFMDSASILSPDGTGALVSGISGPGGLKVTPLDSSHASGFMANQALSKFGHYEASEVSIDRYGNMIDSTNGQIVRDQNGLDRLDQEQRCQDDARQLCKRGYVPQNLADEYDCPFNRYDERMRRRCEREMAGMLWHCQNLQSMLGGFAQMSMPLARYLMGSEFSLLQLGQFA